MVVILQYIQISDHNIVHLKLTQWYNVNYISIKLEEKRKAVWEE